MRTICRNLCKRQSLTSLFPALAVILVQSTFGVVQAIDLTVADFHRLPEAARQEFVISAIATRQCQLRNIKVTTATTADRFEYSGGVLGAKMAPIFVVTETFARLGESYRLDLKRKHFVEGAPDLTNVSGYNSLEGESRMYAYSKQFEDGKTPAARIRHKQDNIVKFYLYGRLLDGGVGDDTVAYVTELLHGPKKISIDVDDVADGENIIIRTSWKHEGYTEHQKYWFDISRGFMLSRWECHGGYAENPFNRDDSLRVEEAAEFDGLWIPLRVTFVAGGGDPRPDFATVSKVEVTEVAIGKVTGSDLAVVFPKGALVTDNTKGVIYREGGVEPVRLAEKRSWSSPSILLGANLFIVGLLLFIARFRFRRNVPSPVHRPK